MTLVCGIVGPIFLFVYFAAQPDATIKWMYWAGLVVTVADILIALGITEAITRRSEA
ncbi:membrane protein [Mycolicibacterium neoaurum]|nr:membrane protein [Mycolicibacterium neoaurum]